VRGKLKIVIPLAVVLALGVTYKMVLAKPPAKPKTKIAGAVYVLPKDFLLNLSDGRYAKLGVALVMKPGAETAAAAGTHEAAATPPEGYGTLPQEALVRDIVTDEVTDVTGRELTSRTGRRKLKHEILDQIHEQTDVEADDVLFTDVAVQ
jgi:flagellar basal body-associated protein FliL